MNTKMKLGMCLDSLPDCLSTLILTALEVSVGRRCTQMLKSDHAIRFEERPEIELIIDQCETLARDKRSAREKSVR